MACKREMIHVVFAAVLAEGPLSDQAPGFGIYH